MTIYQQPLICGSRQSQHLNFISSKLEPLIYLNFVFMIVLSPKELLISFNTLHIPEFRTVVRSQTHNQENAD